MKKYVLINVSGKKLTIKCQPEIVMFPSEAVEITKSQAEHPDTIYNINEHDVELRIFPIVNIIDIHKDCPKIKKDSFLK